jgi:hypothetical protein
LEFGFLTLRLDFFLEIRADFDYDYPQSHGEETMNKELKIPYIRKKHKDEWVVVEVTQRDRYHVPVAGRVLMHDPDREKVYDFGFPLLKQDPKKELYIFFTGEPFPEGVGVILGAI